MPLSGKEMLKKFQKAGWKILKKRGDYVKIGKESYRETIPMHKELKKGLEHKLLKRLENSLTNPSLDTISKIKQDTIEKKYKLFLIYTFYQSKAGIKTCFTATKGSVKQKLINPFEYFIFSPERFYHKKSYFISV